MRLTWRDWAMTATLAAIAIVVWLHAMAGRQPSAAACLMVALSALLTQASWMARCLDRRTDDNERRCAACAREGPLQGCDP